MKYLTLVLLLGLVSCGSIERPEPKKEPTTRSKRHDRLLKCVDRFLDKEVEIKKAYEVCEGIYKRRE